VNVNRRWSGTNGIRVLGAGVLLLATAGLMVFGGSHSRQSGPQTLALIATNRGAMPQASLQKSRPQLLSDLPLLFEPNVGQTDPSVKFMARGHGYSLFLSPDQVVMSLRAHDSSKSSRSEALLMKLAGASPNARLTGTGLLPGKSNYFIGNDPSQWHSNVAQFARVRYENVYPGINLVFYGNQGQLEYDFQVAPGANPSQAELEFDGSKRLELSGGSLLVKGEYGSMQLQAPRVYQSLNGRQQPVEGRFVLHASNRVGFEIGAYDHTRELVIDPVLTYGTYFGGTGDERSPSIAVDNGGNIYLTGSTTTPNLPVSPGVFQGTLNGVQNIFILKLNPLAGAQGIEYLTYLGGGGIDSSAGIAVDGGGNAYVAGTTTSGIGGTADFPTVQTTAYQTAPAPGSTGTSHVFVSVLGSNNGIPGSTLLYSSYLSGNGTDVASGMTIDNKGNLFVTGTTTSTDQASVLDAFPVASPPTAQQSPFQSFPFATKQFFVTKVNTQTAGVASIAYSTYFGGGAPVSGIAIGGGIAVDSTGNIYFDGTTNFIFTGTTRPPDFPILNAFQPCLDQVPPNPIPNPLTCSNTSGTTNTDAFVAKLNPNAAAGSQLIWSTYFGGSQDDSGTGIALSSGAANVFITGTTNSPDLQIPNSIAAYQRCLDTPVNPPAGTACTAPTAPAPTDAFVAVFSNPSSGNMASTYVSYLGGSLNDSGAAITVDTAGGALFTGSTASTDLPFFPKTCSNSTSCVIQSTFGGGASDAFFARLNTTAVTGQSTIGQFVTYYGGTGTDEGTGIAIDSSLNVYLAGDTTSPAPTLQVPGGLQTTENGGFDAFAAKLTTSADLSVIGKLTLSAGQQFVSAGSPATFTYTVTNNGPDVATSITFSDTLPTTGVTMTFNSATATSGSCSQPTSTATPIVCSIASLQSGATSTVTITLTPTSGGQFNGGLVTVSSTENDPNPGNNTAPIVSGTASDFSVDVEPKNVSIPAAGDPAKYLVTVRPINPFGTNISLSASAGLPNTTSTNFTLNPVSLISNSPASSTLTISTTPRPTTVGSSKSWRGTFYAAFLTLPGIAFLGLGASSRRRRRIAGILLMCTLFAVLLLQPACSGSGTTPPVVSGTQPGTYTVTLTATAGGVSHNTTFTLTVP